MLLYVNDLLDTSCYLLIVHCEQQRSCAVLVIVLTLLACISCWLPTLHLVDNAGFVLKKKKKKKKVTCQWCGVVFSHLQIQLQATSNH